MVLKGAIFISKNCVSCVCDLSCSLFADRVIEIDQRPKKQRLEQVEYFLKHKHVRAWTKTEDENRTDKHKRVCSWKSGLKL